MRSGPRRGRGGFTLLEVTLALSIAVFLLGGLYVAVDVQLRHAQAGRDLVEQATLARSLLARVALDIAASATLVEPGRFKSSNNSASSQGGASASSGGGASGSAAATTNTSTSTNSSAVALPLGVRGDGVTLHLYLNKVPREALPTDVDVAPAVVSDLRRVSYWLVGGAGSALGLARQEVAIATSQDATDNLPPGVPNEESFILAPEVHAVAFQYFDGTSWQDTWDSTAAGADGVTPLGPPQAVAITVEIARAKDARNGQEPPAKRYRQVIACNTANGVTAQPTTTSGGTNP